MSIFRRELLGAALAIPALTASAASFQRRGDPGVGVAAVLVDALAVFDTRPIFAQLEGIFPGKGDAIAAAWRTRQFDYQWLRAIGGQYSDFLRITSDALTAACAQLQVTPTTEQRDQLMQGFMQLKAFPDVAPAMQRLQASKVRTAILSNFSQAMLAANSHYAGLDGAFEKLISTDINKSYKPERRAYRLGVEVMRLPVAGMLFVPSAGWDNAGAKWFGYRTCWINRNGAPAETLGAVPDSIQPSMSGLVEYVLASR